MKTKSEGVPCRYYLAMDEENTGQQHLYVVNDQTTADTIRPITKCVTCDVRGVYENCSHFNAYFPPAKVNESKFFAFFKLSDHCVRI